MAEIARRRQIRAEIKADFDERQAKARAAYDKKVSDWKAAQAEAISTGNLDDIPPEPKRPQSLTMAYKFLDAHWSEAEAIRRDEKAALADNAESFEARMAEVELDILSQVATASRQELEALAAEAELLVSTARRVRTNSGDVRRTVSGRITPGVLLSIVEQGGGLLDVAGERVGQGLNVMLTAPTRAIPSNLDGISIDA